MTFNIMEDKILKFNTTNLLKAAAVLEAIVILGLITVIAFFFVRNSGSIAANADPQVRTRAVIEKEETFYQLDGKKILMHNSTMGETFIPVFSDVPASSLDPSGFAADANGFVKYSGNPDIPSIVGIDISEHQGVIDWEQVKSTGIEFVMIRAGYRTYGDGILTMDTMLYDNLSGASEAGLDVGVYFFSQATTEAEAIEEADAVLDAISAYDITYPVVFDWELIYEDHARTDSMTVEKLADCCVAFCERVKSAGYTPMLYQNASTATHKLDLPRVKDYEFWLAEYTASPTFYYEYDMWQYSSTGTIPGITGSVDLNVCFKDYSAPAVSTASE